MKIIDLLNKIAKGEEVPKKIVWHEVVFDYIDGDYFNDNGCSLFRHDEDIYSLLNMLNDEVEIIEEEKEIKKFHYNNAIWEEQARDLDYMFKDKIDELIDVINDMRDKEC